MTVGGRFYVAPEKENDGLWRTKFGIHVKVYCNTPHKVNVYVICFTAINGEFSALNCDLLML